ncbi:hypothetical protein Lalb_Chr01g0011981 [Lupinus albus]|uniref:TRF2/HOY1 PH-like domain-containing protein n=1 Tax=Lupinus albus TaxID=3870 RepID=A0A6A4R719_LUPAL|nr:hypothetical protein Lalb_Chr01g0011981 [Lupinus albus]
MVQLMRSDSENNHCIKKVKLETQNEVEPVSQTQKRPRFDSPQKSGSSDDLVPVSAALYNPLDEPSPLGLRLRKSPSLLDLIQMRLSQQDDDDNDHRTSLKKDIKSVKSSGTTSADSKLKASNFPATVLKIGTWEYKSRYEGDLVVKCYFAKHKLVWEVLDGCLKNKIEIPWSDIMALNANYPDDAPGTMEVVLSRRPLFFREINPQPRKHTLWQATSDFTGGQASIHRRHFMQCPQGLLGKHFEKLIQCDPRLNFLSQQSDLVLDSPYFEPGTDQMDSSSGFDRKSEGQTSFFGVKDMDSGFGVQPTSSKSQHNLVGNSVENVPQEITSTNSVMNTHPMKDFRSRGTETLKFLSNLDQIKLPGLNPSMSMNDLVNHIGNCISEQFDSQYNRSILEEFTQSLFNDTQLTTAASDEQYVMSRVNSLYSLLQKDPSTEDTTMMRNEGGKVGMNHNNDTTHISASASCKSKEVEFEGQKDDGYGFKHGSGISRKESVGELLTNLPRIASLPQFLFHMAQDSGNNHAR